MIPIWSLIKKIGPAFILAAVVLGPGSITLATISGTRYQYQLLWVILFSTIFMMSYTFMAARIGIFTGMSLFKLVRRRYGRTVSQIAGVSGFLSILAFQAGNTAAVGFALNALFGFDWRIGSSLATFSAVCFLLTADLYDRMEFLVKWVVGIMLLTFLGTLFRIGIDFRAAVQGLAPSFPDQDSIFLAVGMSATTFSVAAAAYTGYLMKEKGWEKKSSLKDILLDSIIGIALLGIISAIILMTSAGVSTNGVEGGFTAQTMARQLEPVSGAASFYLFTAGFFFASFSSLAINPLIGATLLLDGLGKNPGLETRGIKFASAIVLFSGLSVVILFGSSPIEVLRIAQAMAIVAFPLLGFLVLRLSADKKIMGDNANSLWLNLLGGLGYLIILAIILNYLRVLVNS